MLSSRSSLWLGMKTLKLNLVRELNALERVYTVKRATLFCFGGIVGEHLYMEVPNASAFFGPLATPWYIVGGVIALAVGKCYGELASLAPCTGAAYDYTYYTMGELAAFLTGWVQMLSLSTKFIFSVRTLTTFIDQYFFNGVIRSSTDRTLKMFDFSETSFFESVPDLPAIPVCLFLGGLCTTISDESATTNSIINITNIIIIVVTFITFVFYTDLSKVHFGTDFNKTTEFFSKGFYFAQGGYTGLELAVYIGEEAVNPSVTIPKCILLATIMAIFCYSTFSFIYSLLPKEVCLNSKGSMMEILKLLDIDRKVGWLIGLGGICSMLAKSYASMFSLTRLVYSMSKDGMLFSFLSLVHDTTKTPVLPTFTLVTILGILGAFIKLKQLFKFATFYTSLEYFLISVCLLLTRYRCEKRPKTKDQGDRWLLINKPRSIKEPTEVTERISILLIINCSISVFAASIFFKIVCESGGTIFIVGQVTCLSLFVQFGIALGQQPQNIRTDLEYSITASPYLPLFLMAHSVLMLIVYSYSPWIITHCWLLLGFVFYLVYSRKRSVEFGRTFPHDPDARWSIMLENEPITVTPSTSESQETTSDDSM